MAASTSKENRKMAASTSKENRKMAASTSKENRKMAASTSQENREMAASTSQENRKMTASTSKEKREIAAAASKELEACIKSLKYHISEAEKHLQQFTEEYGKVQKDQEQFGKLNRSLRKKFETDLKEEVEKRTLIELALTKEQKRISELEEQLLKEMGASGKLENDLKKEFAKRTLIESALTKEQKRISELEEQLLKKTEASEKLENTRSRMTTSETILMWKTKCGAGSSDSELKMKLESERATTEQVPNSVQSGDTSDIAKTPQCHSGSLLEMTEDINVISETAAEVEEFHRLHPKPPENIGNQILDAIESKNVEEALSLFEFRFKANDSDQLETFQKGLYLASTLGYYDIVNCYLNKGVNPNFFVSRETSLHKAAECGHLRTCKLLLMTGAKVDEQTKQTKMTPLHLAAMNGHLDVCDLLISNRASVVAIDMSGCTPLHYAVRSDNLALVKLIIKASTDLCTMNRYGLTPYDYAQALSVSRVQEYLSLIYSNANML